MLEKIRVYVMERIVEKKDFCNKWKNNCGPLIKKKFDEIKKEGVEWEMHWNGEKGYEVKKGRLQYIMDMKKKMSSCRSWQLTGIPCPHVCCAILNDEGNPDDFLDKWYHAQTFSKAFQHALQPINGAHEWRSTCGSQGHNKRRCPNGGQAESGHGKGIQIRKPTSQESKRKASTDGTHEPLIKKKK
ncbi:hypothetical protein PTKIN_Ptkin04bG0067200 [Pterospermum kingtungense]